MNYQNNCFSFSESGPSEYTTEGVSYKSESTLEYNNQNKIMNSDARKQCFTPVTSFDEYSTQKISVNHEMDAEISKLNDTIQNEELNDIDEFTYNYLMNVHVSDLTYNANQSYTLPVQIRENHSQPYSFPVQLKENQNQSYNLPVQITENHASSDIIDVQWIEKRERKTPKKKSSSPRKLNNEPKIPSNEFIILYENLIVHLQHPINLDFLKSIDYWRISNNYTLESLHEFDKDLNSEKYRYLVNADNRSADDLYLPKIIRILKNSPKNKKIEREGMCSFCRFENKGIDGMFYKRNSSQYRGHLIHSHGIFTNGEKAKEPTMGYQGQKVSNNEWMDCNIVACPYPECKEFFAVGEAIGGVHRLHAYFRHCNECHHPVMEAKRLISLTLKNCGCSSKHLCACDSYNNNFLSNI